MRHLRRYPVLWLAILSLGISGIVALFTPLPQPQFHDEFSYLLAGDTLARGRLTNPPHQLWEFFETFQIIQTPSYASKYPPGQGLVRALGQVLFGKPIVGVWISTALAVAGVWWGLRGFVPSGWATVGALIAATHPLMLKWNWSYWGGAVAVIGGALVAGGLARRSTSGGFAGGGGLFLLAISRPFEGVILALLSVLLIPQKPVEHTQTSRFLAALGMTVVAGGMWIAYYNWRVTGSALKLPYSVYEWQYAACPPVIWWPRSGAVPEYRSAVMGDYYLNWELPQYEQQRTLWGFVHVMGEKLSSFASAYFWSIALIIPAGAALFCRDRRALIIATVFTLIVFGNLWFFPHYCAPAVIVYLLVVVNGMKRLEGLRHGRWIVRGVVGLHVLAAAVWIATMDRSESWNHRRAEIIEAAQREGRRLLVIVRPGAGYYPHNEWVYNDADIDGSPVVWARDRGDDNRRLLEYFAGREVWLMEIDAQSMRISDYPR
jgi:hypothetical protein